jgi:homoserine kinase type II
LNKSKVEKELYNDLQASIHKQFDLQVLRAEPIFLGWLNKKWKLHTSGGVYLLKNYNKQRYQEIHTEDINFAKGWAHRDLWLDNILFDRGSVSAILDFDRLRYDYLELDVARVIMSTCFYRGHFNINRVRQFLEGYNLHYTFELEWLDHSLQLLYWLECEWWITSSVTAFIDE